MNEQILLPLFSFSGKDEISPLFLISKSNDEPVFISDLSDSLHDSTKSFITFFKNDVVQFARENDISINCELLEITTLASLVVGSPHKSAIRDGIKLNIWDFLFFEYYINSSINFKNIRYLCSRNRYFNLSQSDKFSLINFVKSLKINIATLIERMNDIDESNRYHLIERKIDHIFTKTMLKGIHIDNLIINSKINYLRKEVEQSRKMLRYQYGILDVDDIEKVKTAFNDEGNEVLGRIYEINSLDRVIKLMKPYSKLASILYDFRRNRIDLSALIKLNYNEEVVCYPSINCMGTVTGRILLYSPGFQYISRKNRNIILPKPGYKLIYIDFCQFEPGILASLCGDPRLIEDYNKGDLYSELSRVLFPDKGNRAMCKLIFICFMYGMKATTLAKMLATVDGGNPLLFENKLKIFFERYDKIEPYKLLLQNNLLREGRLGTTLGNYRNRKKIEDKLTSEEKRWALNQVVQGKASLILKKAIIKLDEVDDSIEILIPMHDALLVQVEKSKVIEKEKILKEVFENVFMDECSGIIGKVSFENFYSD